MIMTVIWDNRLKKHRKISVFIKKMNISSHQSLKLEEELINNNPILYQSLLK